MDMHKKEFCVLFCFLKNYRKVNLRAVNTTFPAATMYTLKADCNLVLAGEREAGQRMKETEPPLPERSGGVRAETKMSKQPHKACCLRVTEVNT